MDVLTAIAELAKLPKWQAKEDLEGMPAMVKLGISQEKLPRYTELDPGTGGPIGAPTVMAGTSEGAKSAYSYSSWADLGVLKAAAEDRKKMEAMRAEHDRTLAGLGKMIDSTKSPSTPSWTVTVYDELGKRLGINPSKITENPTNLSNAILDYIDRAINGLKPSPTIELSTGVGVGVVMHGGMIDILGYAGKCVLKITPEEARDLINKLTSAIEPYENF